MRASELIRKLQAFDIDNHVIIKTNFNGEDVTFDILDDGVSKATAGDLEKPLSMFPDKITLVRVEEV